MKKIMLLLLVVCPFLFSATWALEIPLHSISQKETPLIKGTSSERKALDRIWYLLKAQKFTKLKNALTHDFHYFDIQARTHYRTAFIRNMSEANHRLLSYQLSNVKIQSEDNFFIATFLATVSVQAFPSAQVPIAQSMIFVKEGGKWKLKTYVDLTTLHNVE